MKKFILLSFLLFLLMAFEFGCTADPSPSGSIINTTPVHDSSSVEPDGSAERTDAVTPSEDTVWEEVTFPSIPLDTDPVTTPSDTTGQSTGQTTEQITVPTDTSDRKTTAGTSQYSPTTSYTPVTVPTPVTISPEETTLTPTDTDAPFVPPTGTLGDESDTYDLAHTLEEDVFYHGIVLPDYTWRVD